MENLTSDQAYMLFVLFIAQNADKKISDLFPSDTPCRQVKIGTLEMGNNGVEIWVEDDINEKIPFRYQIGKGFSTWDNYGDPWYSFNIMKYIYLEDKV
jgi:hypothetical protein